jgi:hypothetical protein
VPVLLETRSGVEVLRTRRVIQAQCARAGCDGEHTPSIHELMGEESNSVNLIAEDDDECDSEEDEEWWVGTVRMEEVQEGGGEVLEELDEPELEREARFSTYTFTQERTTPSWRTGWRASGTLMFRRTQEHQRRAGGGARSPLRQAPKRMEKRFSI